MNDPAQLAKLAECQAAMLRRRAAEEYRKGMAPGGLITCLTVARVYREQAAVLERKAQEKKA